MVGCYYVVPHANAWLVKFEDGEYGPYRNETDATDFAVRAAWQLGTCERSEVFVLRHGERQMVREHLWKPSQKRRGVCVNDFSYD